jgi:hypothetical protein
MEHPLKISRRIALGLPLGAWAMSTQAAAAQPPVLMELFTSQGCSSCPPADALAQSLLQRPDVVVVTFHVDYWDYLGWRDTLGSPDYSDRQRAYALERGDGSVYTPQAIINGGEHVVGSQERALEAAIATAAQAPLQVPVTVAMGKKEITVRIAAAASAQEATLWLLAVKPQAVQNIARGENAGQKITYVNVVRNLVPAAMWEGETYEGRWMKDAVLTDGATHIIAVLQKNKTGPILGFAKT